MPRISVSQVTSLDPQAAASATSGLLGTLQKGFFQANLIALLTFLRRRIVKPIAPMPSIIMPQVAGSGTVLIVGDPLTLKTAVFPENILE